MSRILLVEDDRDSADMLGRRLEDKGYEVIHAGTGGEALEMAESQRPDLILMDIRLPDTDGLEMTRTIRRTPSIKDIPIIALTAYALTHHKQEALDAGCDDHHPKPVFFMGLLEQMERLLRAHKSA